MSIPRILITGASGFLGGHLCRVAAQEGEVVGAFHLHDSVPKDALAVQMDLQEETALRKRLEEIDPQILVHAAVMQVDACEHNPELAERINVQASRSIAEWCARRRRRLVYISSDLVFDGAKGNYREIDVAQPVMIYGKTKLAAEQEVLRTCSSACVARLPLMYGFPVAGGSNFFLSMLARLQRGESSPVFHDQYRTPGLVNNLAAAVWELACSDYRGIMHLAGATRCSRYEFARSVCRFANLNEALLQPVSMFETALPAPRPQDVSLDCSLANSVLHTKLLEVEKGLQLILQF